jgi:hypothetical protein
VLTVTLDWQMGGETGASEKVFVHLVDSAGQIVAQSDALPADGLPYAHDAVTAGPISLP